MVFPIPLSGNLSAIIISKPSLSNLCNAAYKSFAASVMLPDAESTSSWMMLETFSESLKSSNPIFLFGNNLMHALTSSVKYVFVSGE